MTDSNGISKLYTLKELAEIIKVTERTLYTYVKNGRVQGVKIGGKGKIAESSLQRFINGGGSPNVCK